jgi:hypothetical protein
MWLSNLLPNFWVSARRPPPSLAAKSLILGHGNPIPWSRLFPAAMPSFPPIRTGDYLPPRAHLGVLSATHSERVGADILVGATDQQVRTLLPLHQRELGPNRTWIQSPSPPRFHSTGQSQSCLLWEFQEGQGQQDWKLAVVRHPRRRGSL